MSFLNYLRVPPAVIATASLFIACTVSDEPAGETGNASSGMDTLVTADWLERNIDDPDLVVLDCTVLIEQTEDGGYQPVSGRANYEAGHIPSAGFADLMVDLSDADSPLRFAVPKPDQFAAAMGALGVGNDTRVVLYDANNSAWAARVWWMLRWIGFDKAALLDGGLNAWTADGRPLSTEPPNRPARQLSVNLRPELIVDRDDVLAALDDDSVSIIDALSPAQFKGEISMYDRPGHIPGASNVPMFAAFDETGRFRPKNELAEIFGGDPDDRTINYCGGGIAASANAFVLTHLGFKDVAVYTASLQEWAADPANPMETGPAPDNPGDEP